ncbi:hypothetical protein D3C87_1081880 [compost metagenome]
MRIYANFLVLEGASQRKLTTLVTGQVQKIALEEMNAAEERSKKSPAGNKIGSLADKYLTLGQLFAKPSDFLKKEAGYGLPSKEESAAAQRGILSSGEMAVQIEKEATDVIDSLISAENLKEKEELETNAKLLSVTFRSLMLKTAVKK